MSSTEENKSTEQKKEQVLSKDKPQTALTEEEKSAWEKAAETIAGDNKLLASVLKMVLSPFALIAGAGLLVYCFFEIKKHKEEIEKLKTENKKITDEKKELKEENEKVKKKYKKWKALSEEPIANNIAWLPFIQQQALPIANEKKKAYQTNYLD